MNHVAQVPSGLLWGSAGWVVASQLPRPDDGWQPIYPSHFESMVRKFAGGDPRIVEGALGLRFRAFEDEPGLRFYYFSDPDYPAVSDISVDLDGHALVTVGLAENRWPVRAFLPDQRTCVVGAFESTGFVETRVCDR